MAINYPQNPVHFIEQVRKMNETARTLRNEGWTVRFNLADDKSRVWIEISQSNSCDAPAEVET